MTPSEVQDLFLSFPTAEIERTMAVEMTLCLDTGQARISPKARLMSATAQWQDGAD